jgi:hypothetical protein
MAFRSRLQTIFITLMPSGDLLLASHPASRHRQRERHCPRELTLIQRDPAGNRACHCLPQTIRRRIGIRWQGVCALSSVAAQELVFFIDAATVVLFVEPIALKQVLPSGEAAIR